MKKWILLLILVMLLSSCSKTKSFSEVLFESDCELPCWQGLQPGISKEQDFQKWFINNTKIVYESLSLITNRGEFNSIIVYQYKDYDVGANMYYKDNVLYALWFSGQTNISIKTLIQKLGEPENIIIVHVMREGDILVDEVNLIFPQKGVIATYRNQNKEGIIITKDLVINQIVISDTRNIEDCLANILAPNLVNQNKYIWNGYGTYSSH